MSETASRWFLSPAERGNRATHVHADGDHAWSEGNLVTPLVHGAGYFARLHEELSALQPGDRVWFTDWRGDADERLTPTGPTIGELLASLARRGVEVRALIWRSHGERASAAMSGRTNARLGRMINEAGGEALLDQRVRLFGSHHQKFVVIRRRDEAAHDVAFVGGIDLCHTRRDDAEHHGDPQALSMDARYGPRPAWHDAALELRGPVIADLLALFAERWDDPTPLDHGSPYRMLLQRLAHMPRHPKPLPEAPPPPPPAGTQAVQLLRTYGVKRPPFPFAPQGERSIARAYAKAFSLARDLIYLEDQYLWSKEVASGMAEALRRNPALHLIAVVPRYPDSDGAVTGPMFRVGQIRAINLLRRAAPNRVGFFDLENESGTPIYIHAKVCVVDDAWMTCGSDNFNRRSWTSDSELTCGVVDTAGGSPAKAFRLQLWSEHLGLSEEELGGIGAADALRLFASSAAALDAWHAGGGSRPRPTGRVRRHRPEPITRLQRLLADPMYRLAVDPDGRPRAMRGTTEF